MPSLDAFDDEFEREGSDIVSDPRRNTGFRLSTLIGLALAAGVISALALGWPNVFGLPRSEPQGEASVPNAGEKPEATISRLRRELEALKEENRELTQAQQQAADTIATLQTGEQESRGSLASWYSDMAALTHGIATQSDGGTTTGRRSSAVRAKPREVPRHDDAGPGSLEPRQ